ncbi:MAG TPA: ABC transporter substrate-binding protein [Aliicoccus persicus]|uniref:ABC transporter substrate-binding protein n=1 Tax=Aliicoccus persicus TaxID=930138 RepID=A0A921JDB1_9STAP|nr:ABC transporter substrate-binding protein [Aliicoccus persicus]
MKQIYLLLTLSLIIGIGALFSTRFIEPPLGEGDSAIHIFNWGEYIDPDLLDQFTEETGIRVIYETFDSNEAMLVKINQGGTSYDLAMPSEYMVEKMQERDMLIEIDHEQLPNLEHIGEQFLGLDFDPENKYSVPYFWGTVGVLFHPEKTDLDFTDWDMLWDESLRNEILLVDSAREVMGFSLNSMGESLNETDPDKLDAAFEKLVELAPNVRGVVGDEIMQMMINNESIAAVIWSGSARDVMWENEELDYVVPEGGSNLWFDTFVIPETANNIEGAHQFINFMLEPENAAQNADYVGYSTPNDAGLSLLDEEEQEDTRFYPTDAQQDTLEVYKNLGLENLGIYNELFLKFKMNLE